MNLLPGNFKLSPTEKNHGPVTGIKIALKKNIILVYLLVYCNKYRKIKTI
jgi:hypothetical protein